MEFEINHTLYPIKIQRKKNKNTYIRIHENFEIFVTTSFFTTNKQIYSLLEENRSSISQMISRKKKELEKEEQFYYLGKKYDIIIVPTVKTVEIIDHYIYAPNMKILQVWYQKQIRQIFEEHVQIQYRKFEEKIPFPKMKIRKMKTRWGVCNKRDTSITLNSNLMKEKLECLDYVIVHELSHFVHFNHSKEFWNTVEKYCPHYKKIRNSLKE